LLRKEASLKKVAPVYILKQESASDAVAAVAVIPAIITDVVIP